MPLIPEKQYFKIGEVSELLQVKPHVLRYWETEFGLLRPEKSKTNQRLYRKRDVEILLHVRELLYQQGYTIAGAKKKLREVLREKLPPPSDTLEILEHLQSQVEQILKLVSDDDER